MKKILVIETYLSKDFSVSEYALKKFIEEYKKLHPEDQFVYLNLNNEKKLESVLTLNNFSSFWNEQSDKYINLIKEADKIIINNGMINFTISPLLKNFFDNILQANKTFRYKYEEKDKSEGLVDSNKKVMLLLAQGSYKDWYKFSAFDDYLVSLFHFMGITQVQKILFDGTKTHDQQNLTIEQKYKLKEKELLNLVKVF